MRIHNVNMAVPVGQPDRDTTTTETLASEVDAEMQALKMRCIQAVQQRGQWAFTQRQRQATQRQFDAELKNIVKKLASTACSDIADRDTKTQMRVRLYTDLSTVASALSTEVDSQINRTRQRKKWISAAAGVLLIGFTNAAWMWLG